MLDPDVMRITLVYAEKVKFISFTLRPSNPAAQRCPPAPQNPPWTVRYSSPHRRGFVPYCEQQLRHCAGQITRRNDST